MQEHLVNGRKRKPFSQLMLANGDVKSRKLSQNLSQNERRAGVIEHMTLKNFMCHSLLEVDFVNNISMIIGKNGSGKSAILTALIVGLAGKASLTNRGNSIKGFVKAGRNSSSVEIQLNNEGPMAYRPNVFGKKIIIIRTFSASGSSQYKIKSENGQIIATQVREINNITASLNIQVDNPVCILNQDTSRNFLNSNDPKHKYTLFMKATRLEILLEEFKKVSTNKRESIRLLEDKQTSFKAVQEEIRRLKRKIDNHKSIISLKDQVQQMQIELLWSKVRDSEVDHAQEEAKVNKLKLKLDSLIETCNNRNGKVDGIKENIVKIEQQINELRDAVAIQTKPEQDLKRILDELKSKYNGLRSNKQLEFSSIESKTKDIKILEQEIANVNESTSRVEQEKLKRLRNLMGMEEKIKGMEDHLVTCRNDLFQIKSDVARKEEDKRNLKQEISQTDSKISNEVSSLSALKNESGNTLLLYGRDMPQIKELIEKNKNKFTNLPRGPLGYYIKLKDKKWAVAVEGYIGQAMLCAFTVDNKNDNKLIVDIFNSVCGNGRKPMIITAKFFTKKHDVSRNIVHAPPDCTSLYDALDIVDPVVSNCIVDQLAPEGILLIPSTDRAIQLLSNRSNVPTNCHQGVTIKGDRFFPDPNYKTYGSLYHRAQYLQVNTKEYILQLQQKIEQLRSKKQVIVNQYQEIINEMSEQERKSGELEEKIRKLNAARMQIRKQLEDLKATAEPEVANVQLLENELTELRKIVKDKTTLIANLDIELKEMKSIMENDEKLQQIKKSNKSLEDRILPLEAQIKEYVIRQKEISTNDEFDKRRVKEIESQLKGENEILVNKRNILEKQTEQASELGERINDLRPVQQIMNEISDTERSIRRIQTDADKVEDVIEKYKELHNKFKITSEIMTNLNDDVTELTIASDKRNRHYKLTETYFMNYIKHSFKKILEFRQFKGSLEIDLTRKTLDLIVIPQQGSQGITTTSNLSGGERSFSTVAFLYSLWQCMDFPFYFLDEFDVYMDKLNRTKVIEVLLHHAKSRPTLQFVFLTPQDVSFIDKTVTILRLEDPERIHT